GTSSRFLRPKPGWSNLVPMVTVPRSAISAIVVPDSKSVSLATSGPSSESLPQAARANDMPATARMAFVRVNLMFFSLCCDHCCESGVGGRGATAPQPGSVLEDLAEEVLGAVGLWVREELLRSGLLHD